MGSIIIESCDQRWNATLENELVRDALLSEMKAAHDLGIKYNRPVVLGDQDINITVSELKNGAKVRPSHFYPIHCLGFVYIYDIFHPY